MKEQEISYALAKQVPDMARGFTVTTGYGSIVIPAGKLARHLQANMERALVRELGLQTAQRVKRDFIFAPMSDAQIKSAMADIFGKPRARKVKPNSGGAV